MISFLTQKYNTLLPVLSFFFSLLCVLLVPLFLSFLSTLSLTSPYLSLSVLFYPSSLTCHTIDTTSPTPQQLTSSRTTFSKLESAYYRPFNTQARCRMLLYKGRQSIQLAHLLTKPAHSIINQSFDSRMPLEGSRRLINGDGFGVGWYESEPISETMSGSSPVSAESNAAPCIFTSVTPAWNNMNLIRLADKIKSPLVFAHVRASTAGSVSESNCHPFQYGRLMFMHHGMIADFHLIKRKVQESLSDEIYLTVNGNTDSEWAFAVFLSQLDTPRQVEPFSHETLKQALLNTISKLNFWSKAAGIQDRPSTLNFAITDGVSVVCTRYINAYPVASSSSSATSSPVSPSRPFSSASRAYSSSSSMASLSSSIGPEPNGLYFSSGTRFECYKEGHYKMVKESAKAKREDVVLIASEPLTLEEADWLKVPRNTVLVITGRMNVLMYPIKDEYSEPRPIVSDQEDSQVKARDLQHQEVEFVGQAGLGLEEQDQSKDIKSTLTVDPRGSRSIDSNYGDGGSGSSASSTPDMPSYPSPQFLPSSPSSAASSSSFISVLSDMGLSGGHRSKDTDLEQGDELGVLGLLRQDSGHGSDDCGFHDEEDDYRIFPVRSTMTKPMMIRKNAGAGIAKSRSSFRAI